MPKLYIWDDCVLVLAKTIEEATEIAVGRVAYHPSLVEMVRETIPQIISYPGATIVFHSTLSPAELLCEV